MEAALLAAVFSIVSKKLAHVQSIDYGSIVGVGVTKDLQDLHALMEEVNSCLEIAGGEVAGSWFRRFKDFVYDVGDFLDEFQLMAEKHHAASSFVSKYMSKMRRILIFRNKVKALKNRLCALVKEITNLRATVPADHLVRDIIKIVANIPSDPSVDDMTTTVRAEEKEAIISKLVETNDQHNINIVSIVGLGGLGKTALAKLVFSDDYIKKHFQVTLWVHMQQEFDVDRLVRKIFEALHDNSPGQHGMPHMEKIISDTLIGKRVLLVLDDVWIESRFQWEMFLEFFINIGAPGSRILLTTRSSKVALIVGPRDLFELPLLSEASSWQLFTESYGTAENGLDPAFVEVSKEIVKKCGGVPLAIKVVATALCGKKQIQEWYAYAMQNSNLLVGVEGGKLGIITGLMLSYFHMPSHLKQCLTICSMFPKGYRVDKEKLIDLWITHGMITVKDGADYLENSGHRCFNSLVRMSFLQDVHEEYGRVTCSMHDLAHDLSRTILGDEISLVPEVATSSTKSSRYFSITEVPLNLLPKNIFEEAHSIYFGASDGFKFGKALQNARHLHSIIMDYVHTNPIPTAIFQVKNLKYLEISRLKCETLPDAISNIWSLQALQATYCDILSLPISIGNLQKLRTINLSWCKQLKSLPDSIRNCQMISNLDLSGCSEFEVFPDFFATNKRLRVLRIGNTKIERLPTSVTSFSNLECLDLQQCHELVELPQGLENMEKLKALNLEGCQKLRAIPVGIGQLCQLQNLNTFFVGDIGNSAKLSELGNIRRVRGGLTIKGIESVIDPDDAQKACLKEKRDLQRLQLQWRGNSKHKNIEAVLDALEPPSGIEELYIDGYAGGQYAQWMLKQVGSRVQGLSHFPYLSVMTLCGFPNLKHLDGLMGLPCLKELNLRWMPSLKSISGGSFPSLVKLRMEGLRGLGEIWMVTERTWADGKKGQMEIGICLSDLHIEECTKLVVKSHFPSSLKHLVLQRSNEQLLVLPVQGQETSSSSSFPPCYSFRHLKNLELWGMTASLSSAPAPPRPGSRHGWELLQHMTTLESLKICRCSGITEMPESIRSLKSLRSLYINFCCAICILPEWLGELRSLQKMAIQSCHSLTGLPQSIGHLISLQELRIERCDELHQLPESLGELCSLRKFDIASLQGLTFLPKSMCCLTSLEELEISDCQGLTSLPEWRGLRSLQKLKITGCPDLERRCEREKGEDWHLINHIPHLQIGLDEGEPAC